LLVGAFLGQGGKKKTGIAPGGGLAPAGFGGFPPTHAHAPRWLLLQGTFWLAKKKKKEKKRKKECGA